MSAERWQILTGDCLEILPTIPAGSIDAVIIDPPYASGARTAADMPGRGGMSRSELWKKSPIPNDTMTTVGFVWFIRAIASQCTRALKRHGSLLCFIDWRQYPQLCGALESVNLRIQNVVVWDKQNMALGNGFRNQHELIIHCAKGTPVIYNKGTPNVIGIDRVPSSDIHPTQKPVPLISKLLAVVSKPGDLILDPLAGSGSTGVAAIQDGRRFIGIELDPTYAETARRRCREAAAQPPLFTEAPAPIPAAEQPDLFAMAAD